MELSRIIESRGISNIRFYNSTLRRVLAEPILPVVRFMDILILGKDARFLPHLREVLNEARRCRVPVISEENLWQLQTA
jgi:hypothetical protein